MAEEGIFQVRIKSIKNKVSSKLKIIKNKRFV